MKTKLFFRIPAVSCAGRIVLAPEYFGVPTDTDGYSFEPSSFRDRLEYGLFKMIVGVWRKRKSSMFYMYRFNLDEHDRNFLKEVINHARKAWGALENGDECNARLEFEMAVSSELRFGMEQMNKIAGKALLDAQRRSIDGRRNIKKRWKNNSQNMSRDKNIVNAIKNGSSISDIASSYKITNRRVQQIYKEAK